MSSGGMLSLSLETKKDMTTGVSKEPKRSLVPLDKV